MRWSREISRTKILKREIPFFFVFLFCVFLIEIVAEIVSLSEKSPFFVRYYESIDTWINKWHIIAFIYFSRLIYVIITYKKRRDKYLKSVKESCIRKSYYKDNSLLKNF